MTRNTSGRETHGGRLVERGAAAFYRALLVCYPRTFRAVDGPSAAALFGEACRDDWVHARVRTLGRRVVAAIVTVPREGLAERRARRREINSGEAASSFGVVVGVWTDLRYAVRSILRQPALSATIVGTLAIGLGTNTAVFSVIDATLLRPTPYVDARRVMLLQAVPRSGEAGDPRLEWARAWAEASHSIARLEARRWRSALIVGGTSATRKAVIEATPGYLPSIGARPLMGRLLVPADSRSGAAPVVVITSSFWRAQFGERADIVGDTIRIDGVAHQIVGVASEIASDVPGLTFSAATALSDAPGDPARVVAWVRSDVPLERAQAEVRAMASVDENGNDLRPQLSPVDAGFWRITEFRTLELGLVAASLLLIVIAGVNVVNLLLAAGEARLGELAVRRALGASPHRLIRLLLIETAVLTVAGAAIGLAIALAIVRGLAALDAGVQLQTELERIHLDPVIVGYTCGIAFIMTITAGLVPAMRAADVPAASLKDGARGASRLRRGASTLVAVETALAAVLLVAAGLVGHAFLSMHFADRGFDANRVLGVRIALPGDKYATPASRAAFFDALVNNVSRVPGVERAGIGYSAATPFEFVMNGQWSVAGSTSPPTQMMTALSFVSPGYFSLMGIPLLQGADFTAADDAGAGVPVQPAIVSRSLAKRLWADGDAVGTVFEVSSTSRRRRYRVIGVSGDVTVWGLLSPTCHDCDMQVYAPLPESRQFTDVLLRVRPGAAMPVAALRAAVARLDPDVPSDDSLQTAEEGLSEFIRLPRFTAALFSAFAVLAISLVAVGLAAVVSHAVARRTREMGIRLALGATPQGVRRLVVVQGMRPALVGLVIGLGVALMATRYLRALLYGFSPADPVTLVAVPLIVMAIALAALAVPAFRATRVDPMRALRTE